MMEHAVVTECGTPANTIVGSFGVKKVFQCARCAEHEARLLTRFSFSGCVISLLMRYTPGQHSFVMMRGEDIETVYPPGVEASTHEVFRQLLAGVRYLHEHGVAHLDLKPENTVCVGKRLQIIDFGSAKEARPGQCVTSRLTTWIYAAPELECDERRPWTHTPYDPFKAEVWSLGVYLAAYCQPRGQRYGSHDEYFTPWPDAKHGEVGYDFWKQGFRHAELEKNLVLHRCLFLYWLCVMRFSRLFAVVQYCLTVDARKRPNVCEVESYFKSLY